MTGELPGQPPMLPRRRVTAPQRLAPAARTSSDADTQDASAVYLGTLIRAQLRLATMLAISFVAVLAVASFVIATLPVLQVATVFGVPWSWALQAYGMYPLVVLFALVYARTANINERRYRSLEPRR